MNRKLEHIILSNPTVTIVSTVVLTLTLALGVACVRANMESKTYNRLTGADTTWWDALWVELRVIDGPKNK